MVLGGGKKSQRRQGTNLPPISLQSRQTDASNKVIKEKARSKSVPGPPPKAEPKKRFSQLTKRVQKRASIAGESYIIILYIREYYIIILYHYYIIILYHYYIIILYHYYIIL